MGAPSVIAMTKIFNVKVYGLEESLKASGYPMKADKIEENLDGVFFCGGDEGPIETCFLSMEEREDAIKRGIKLGNAPGGSGHDNYLKGIIVQFDMEYTQYFSPQFQRYHFHDIVSSQSKMHRITKMDIDESCNEHVDKLVKDNLKYWIKMYNQFDDLYEEDVKRGEAMSTGQFGQIVKAIFLPSPRNSDESRAYTKYDIYMKVISNCPLGFKLTMRVTTNYQQLKTIHTQRRYHKLKEDWGPVCDFAEQLPMFRKLCLKGE